MSLTDDHISELVDLDILNRALLGIINDGIDIVDEDLNIVWQNEKFVSLFGKEAIGRKCFELYKDDKIQCDKCPLKDLSSLENVRTHIQEGVCGGKTFAIHHAPLMLKNGRRAILEVFKDISVISSQKDDIEKQAAIISDLSNKN